MAKSQVIIVAVSLDGSGLKAFEVPTDGNGTVGNGGLPNLTKSLANGWTIQSIQQLGQLPSGNGIVSLFCLVQP